jgi:hypothetical protein
MLGVLPASGCAGAVLSDRRRRHVRSRLLQQLWLLACGEARAIVPTARALSGSAARCSHALSAHCCSAVELCTVRRQLQNFDMNCRHLDQSEL